MSLWQSYSLCPATPSGRIRTDFVVALLNKSRVGIVEPLKDIPSDLLSPEQVVERFADSGITLKDIRRWTHRRLRVPPHFRLTRNMVRFSESGLRRWLDEESFPRDRRHHA